MSGIGKMKKELSEDKGLLLAWHSNISCWLEDKCGIDCYDERQENASNFIYRFFDIKYDWEELLNVKGQEREAEHGK